MEIRGYIGTYTESSYGGKSKGIYSFQLNSREALIKDIDLVFRTGNPSYLSLSPSGRHLYAVNELGEGRGGLSAFKRDKRNNTLIFQNNENSLGNDPCHVTVNRRGSHAFVSNYSSGTLAVFPIGKDGSLGKNTQLIKLEGKGQDKNRQEASHAHQLFFDRQEKFAFVCDLGADRLMAYRFNAAEKEPLSPAAVPCFKGEAGAGPRHGIFHPSGKYCYLLNELNSSICSLSYRESSGGFEKIQSVSTLPPDNQMPSTAAAIKISPNGKFLYATNRGHDSIAVFAVDSSSGFLESSVTVSSWGQCPRDFTISPDGNFLLCANQNSDTISLMKVDKQDGGLTMVRSYHVPTPVCIILG